MAELDDGPRPGGTGQADGTGEPGTKEPVRLLSARDLTVAARLLDEAEDTDGALTAICDIAVHITHADAAGVTLKKADSFDSRGQTSRLVSEADRLQYDLDEGPCVAAAEHNDVFRADDLGTDERWPRFGRAATELGVCSMLSYRLATGDDVVGALNLYAGSVDAFDETDEHNLSVFAGPAAIALRAHNDRERARNLAAALQTNRRIGAAMGVLMATRGLQLDEAFDLLRTESQHRNVKVAALAETVLYTGTL